MSIITVGDIAFVGPTHVPSLDNFTYVRITKIHGTSATVRCTGPDSAEESAEFNVKVSTLCHRIVSDDETEHWPRSYVDHPIEFIQASGEACDRASGEGCDQWAYGLVNGYSMVAKLADYMYGVAPHLSGSGLPAIVKTMMLSMPFNSDEMIICYIKPDTLEIVTIRRQHIVDCELNGRSVNPTDVFTDPQATSDAV
ncbi:hypothetical protein PHMEG_00019766 [Phytophthora megakarya]|uniref:Uncharacterized protein n=1 Tax=Phytophthora megakarya TaxID=4795 RepID=A0A225VQQ9_9STRA|nr:hypothetical protein PHMEG_00019766 [Phytophthora megakarya]